MMDLYEQRIVDDVERVGWHVIGVGPAADSDDSEEWFAYTVGLGKTFGWSDLICFGLDLSVMPQLLNDTVDECRVRSVKPAPGLVLNDVIDGFPARIERAKPMADHYINSARWFARRESLPSPSVLQLLWPDTNGAFPDEPGCSEEVRQLQTPLEAA